MRRIGRPRRAAPTDGKRNKGPGPKVALCRCRKVSTPMEIKEMNAFSRRLASRLALALGLVALAAPVATATAATAEEGSYGYLSVVEGSATLMQAGTDERGSAEINQPVLAGDRLWVPDRSRVEIVLADRNILRIDGGSELVLERLAASPDRDDRATVLRLLEGNVQLVVTQDSLGDELPRIETPNATIFPQDFGSYRITADSDGWSELVVRRGSAEVVTDRGKQRVRADEQAVIDGDRYASADVRPAEGFDSLERWARQLDDQYASADLRHVDDNLRYSAAPLSRYGDWIDAEGSTYWRPRVAAGWRPYWQGRWVYTPSGLTWISSEPWGWAPYHYGSWDYLPVHGWVWQPGRVYASAWVYWYWGPSYVGWCPTGYYTRYYGSRFGSGFGFRSGLYGWAGGDWGYFDRWSFVRSSYFHDGYRQGYRDGYWDGRRDVQRYAVPRSGHDGRSLDRGIITTDTRPLKPSTWKNPDEVLRALRSGRSAAELPDVTSFIARKPNLPDTVSRTVRADNSNVLDGTPLKPSTLGRRAGRAAEAGGAQPGGNYGTPSERPRIVFGDDGPRGAGPSRKPDVAAKPGTQTSPDGRSGGSPAPQDRGRREAEPPGPRAVPERRRPRGQGAAQPAGSGSRRRRAAARPRQQLPVCGGPSAGPGAPAAGRPQRDPAVRQPAGGRLRPPPVGRAERPAAAADRGPAALRPARPCRASGSLRPAGALAHRAVRSAGAELAARAAGDAAHLPLARAVLPAGAAGRVPACRAAAVPRQRVVAAPGPRTAAAEGRGKPEELTTGQASTDRKAGVNRRPFHFAATISPAHALLLPVPRPLHPLLRRGGDLPRAGALEPDLGPDPGPDPLRAAAHRRPPPFLPGGGERLRARPPALGGARPGRAHLPPEGQCPRSLASWRSATAARSPWSHGSAPSRRRRSAPFRSVRRTSRTAPSTTSPGSPARLCRHPPAC